MAVNKTTTKENSHKPKGAVEFHGKLLALLQKTFPLKLHKTLYELLGEPSVTSQGLTVAMRVRFQWGSQKSEVSVQEGEALLFTQQHLQNEQRCLEAIATLKKCLEQSLGKKQVLICDPEEFFPLVFTAKDTDEAFTNWQSYLPNRDALWISTLSQQLSSSAAQFTAVEEKFRRVFNFRLPRHLAAFVGFLAAVKTVYGPEVYESIGISPAGITRWFEPEYFQRAPVQSLDERLYWRFRCDPPEFVSIAHGDTDGLHWGLWYDDPAIIPSAIVSNYARDSGETQLCKGATMLEVIRDRLESAVDPIDDSYQNYLAYYPSVFHRRFVRELVIDARDFETELLSQDGLDYEPVNEMEPILGSIYFPLPGVPRTPPAGTTDDYDNPTLARNRIHQAVHQLAKGNPGLAWVVGHELHWLDRDEFRKISLELLLGAYKLLKRPQLAEIAQLHYDHRDLSNVDIYQE